jgi:hypothetical protein
MVASRTIFVALRHDLPAHGARLALYNFAWIHFYNKKIMRELE